MAADSMEIDDALYSRQRYVLGDRAMQKMAQSHVFLSGMGGLGVEIAKNIVLAGIKTLTIHDTKQCKPWDLGTNFFVHEDDILNLRNRAEATHHHIAELNPYVQVMSSTAPLNEVTDISFLRQYQCVIVTEMKLSLQKKVNDFCHAQHPPIKFISADVYGMWARLFCDFGDEFEVLDTTGEEPKEIFISNISQSNPGIVTCLDNNPHKFETGQFVTFREVNGMSCLNGSTHQITDYCNTLYLGLPLKTVQKLQLLQRAAARLITRAALREHTTHLLHQLHWLLVCYRAQFKVLALACKALNSSSPGNLSKHIFPYQPARD